jgi:hypothetical protein
VEAIHMANLLCQHGYFFPVGECNKNLSVKDDSSLYRFQVNTHKTVSFFPFPIHPFIHPFVEENKQKKSCRRSHLPIHTRKRKKEREKLLVFADCNAIVD